MNLFDLFVTVGLKDEVSDKVPAIGDKLKTGFSVAGKVAAVGIGAATTAVAGLTKAAVDGYADFEQLTGGVETLFKTSSGQVEQYAQNAFKTSGLSANEYMETVTGFSASLLQSLGGDTEKAAEIADQAVIDMADNANKMGSDITMIQSAYQGFAKQNFTMLDNLKLGYGGTKEEMERLLADAERISGMQFDISSFADITQAIHIVQEEMGIAGATAAEAESTISGSTAAMKSAWQNLVVGIADENANIDVLMDNFLTSVGTVADNVLPVVERILSNIFDTLATNGPAMLEGAVELFLKIAAGAVQAIPGIIQSIPTIIEAIADGFVEAWPDIVEIGKDIVRGLWEGIQSLAGWIGEKVSGFFDGLFGEAKKNEEIHSPSEKWAEIGKYDARGFGAGWDSEFKSVRSGITNSLDFGTAHVGFAESGMGRAASAAMADSVSGGRNNKPIVIELTTTLDGEVLSRKMYTYNENEALRRGTAFA